MPRSWYSVQAWPHHPSGDSNPTPASSGNPRESFRAHKLSGGKVTRRGNLIRHMSGGVVSLAPCCCCGSGGVEASGVRFDVLGKSFEYLSTILRKKNLGNSNTLETHIDDFLKFVRLMSTRKLADKYNGRWFELTASTVLMPWLANPLGKLEWWAYCKLQIWRNKNNLFCVMVDE